MNAFNTVNLAGAVILTSASFAKSLGVPSSKWIYPLGGAGTKDSDEFWKRPNFHSSPSISRSIDASLQVSNVSRNDIDLIDIYSCFPIVPKIAAKHLNLPIVGGPKSLTLLGGLTSFGGAGNNYSMHALTEMTRQLRQRKGMKGLVLCNGGVLSYQYVVILSAELRASGNYPLDNPLPAQITDVPAPELVFDADGEAVVEVCNAVFSLMSVC
jgi:acetyl-CoA acetyltransferase